MKDNPQTCSDLKSNTYFQWIKKKIFCTSLQIKFCTSLQIKFCTSLQIKFSTSLQIKFFTSLQIKFSTSLQIKFSTSLQIKFCTSLQIKFCTSLQIKWPEILRIIIKLNYAVSKANPNNFTITIGQTGNNGINLQTQFCTQFCTQFTFFCIMNKLKMYTIIILLFSYLRIHTHIHIYIYIYFLCLNLKWKELYPILLFDLFRNRLSKWKGLLAFFRWPGPVFGYLRYQN